MDEKILRFAPKTPRTPTDPAPAPDPRGYRIYPLAEGDYVLTRPLLDLILLHLVEASDAQRVALAQELATLAGVHL